MPIYKYECPECGHGHTAVRKMCERNDPSPCRADDCDGKAERVGVQERTLFYLRTDHSQAGGDGKRGWHSPGMSGIDYTKPSGPDGLRGHHLTYGYDGQG